MNEQIKEFAILAKEHADSYDDSGTPIWFQMYNEKFAELIVRECANLSENHKGMNDKYFIADAIKKHFGVEDE